jgi:hypothetical protein
MVFMQSEGGRVGEEMIRVISRINCSALALYFKLDFASQFLLKNGGGGVPDQLKTEEKG